MQITIVQIGILRYKEFIDIVYSFCLGYRDLDFIDTCFYKLIKKFDLQNTRNGIRYMF